MPMIETMPHQDKGAEFLLTHEKAALWWVVGAGKTHAVIKALELLGPKVASVLIIAPPIALGMWSGEIAECLGRKVQRVTSGKDVIDPMAEVVVISYALATSMKKKLPCFDAVVCDEAHYLKSATSQRTRAVFGYRGSGKGGLIDNAQYVWLLTATPMTRYADDLYPPLRALAPWRIETDNSRPMNLFDFRNRYCRLEERNIGPRVVGVVVGNRREDELRTKIGDFASRIEKIPGFDVPLLTDVMSIEVENFKLPEDDRTFALLAGAMEIYRHDPSEANRKHVMARLRELSSGHVATLRRLFGTLKAGPCADYLKDNMQDPAVVFYWHRDVGDVLEGELSGAGFEVARIDGATPQTKREGIVHLWNSGIYDVLVGQIAALGVSANLQHGGCRAYFVESDWSPTTVQQAIGRLHRMGQTQPVRATFLSVANSVDETVAITQAHKLRGIDKIIWEKSTS